MALNQNLMGSAAAADLGLVSPTDPNSLDLLKKKKLQQAQQIRDMATKMNQPYGAAFMSLSGNQF